MIQVYNYDVLNYFTGSSYAQENPVNPGTYLMPARTTTDPPPTTGANEIAKWDGAAWTLDVDYRGSWYDVDTQRRIDVWNPGEPQPTNTTDVAPPPNEPTWVFTGAAWERTLEVAKAEKTDEITEAYADAIEVPSLVDGHYYPLTEVFITLLETALEVQSGMIDTYDVEHNTYQLTEVDARTLRDSLYISRLAYVLNREQKYKAINDANTIPEVDGISW